MNTFSDSELLDMLTDSELDFFGDCWVDAVVAVRLRARSSVPFLQRACRIGHGRAVRLREALLRLGFVSDES